MKKPEIVVPVIILVNALIWAFTIIMCSYKLKGTGAYQEIQSVLAAGAIASLMVVGGGIAGVVKKLKSSE